VHVERCGSGFLLAVSEEKVAVECDDRGAPSLKIWSLDGVITTFFTSLCF
jgi:hypothetical protein